MKDTLYRVKQFIKGLTAFGYNNDALINKYLNNEEKELFLKLPGHERKHAIDTANTILNFNIEDNKNELIKAALLHDIGKIESKIGIIKKSILVLMDKFFPKLSYLLSRKINMFYVYYNHPEIGAEYLSKINTEGNIILLVKYHHSDKGMDISGIDILKKADSMN